MVRMGSCTKRTWIKMRRCTSVRNGCRDSKERSAGALGAACSDAVASRRLLTMSDHELCPGFLTHSLGVILPSRRRRERAPRKAVRNSTWSFEVENVCFDNLKPTLCQAPSVPDQDSCSRRAAPCSTKILLRSPE